MPSVRVWFQMTAIVFFGCQINKSNCKTHHHTAIKKKLLQPFLLVILLLVAADSVLSYICLMLNIQYEEGSI